MNFHTFTEKTMRPKWLSDLNFKIHELLIENSNIETIDNHTFESVTFENLEKLVIRKNNLTAFIVEKYGFSGLNSIETLQIEESVLTLNTNFNILAPIKGVLKYLSINQIKNAFIPSRLFESIVFDKLQVLHLNRNNFKDYTFNLNTFKGLHESLFEIYMQSSSFSKFSADAFSGFKCLKVVDLSLNNLPSITRDFFGSSDTIEFTSINFSNSNIQSLSSNTFTGYYKLKFLDLSDNFIEELDARIFIDLENMEVLNLRDNLLQTIPENLFETQLKSGQLKTLDLSGNDWKCNSNIVFLKKFLINTKANVKINDCVDPYELNGRNISELWCNMEQCTLKCYETDERVLTAVLNIFDTVSRYIKLVKKNCVS